MQALTMTELHGVVVCLTHGSLPDGLESGTRFFDEAGLHDHRDVLVNVRL